jgi:uncharacterized protein (DUF2235 family)
MADDAVLAPIASEPALPLCAPTASRKAALAVTPAELAGAVRRCIAGQPIMMLRFSGDTMSPTERFAALRTAFGHNLRGIEIDSSSGNPWGIRSDAHSVLTSDFNDEAGHPTRKARDEVIGFLRDRLIARPGSPIDAASANPLSGKGTKMAHRLVLCFDGTWDRPDPNAVESNVCRFYESVRNGMLPDGSAQQKWYDTGVGTNWYDRISGGAFGLGLDQKIKEGYQWLVDNYPDPDPGDYEVFVLGFSRGAYTARSFVGMIRNVGLLLPGNSHRVDEAYAIYRQRDEGPDTNQATTFRERYAREIKIKFLGVWDTVGALGIPLHALQWLNAQEYAFHDTELSGIVENAAHAIAIDEWRVDYKVALWSPVQKPGQNAEQRWFVGAHADVGGGYADRRLSDITLKWMQDHATAAGLAIDSDEVPKNIDDNWRAGPTNSYQQFLAGIYAQTHEPFYRPMQLGAALNQVLDSSVKKRFDGGVGYAPKNPGFAC